MPSAGKCVLEPPDYALIREMEIPIEAIEEDDALLDALERLEACGAVRVEWWVVNPGAFEGTVLAEKLLGSREARVFIRVIPVDRR